MLKNIKNYIITLIAFFLIIMPGLKIKAAENDAAELVKQALSYKTFYHFNLAYSKVINMPKGIEREQLLNQLAPIGEFVWTNEISQANKMLEDMIKTSSARNYAEIQVFVESSSLGEWDKGYLLGELTSWGRKLVWTNEYTYGVEAVVKSYSENTLINVMDAVKAVNNVSNKLSREYLMDELSYALQKVGLMIPGEYSSGKGLYVIFDYLIEDSLESSTTIEQVQKLIDTAVATNESTKLVNWFGRENRPKISLSIKIDTENLMSKILASNPQLLPDTKVSIEMAGLYSSSSTAVFEPSPYLAVQDGNISINKRVLPSEGYEDNIFVTVEYRTGSIETILFVSLLP